MEILIERRAAAALPSLGFCKANSTTIVQQGIVVQACFGSVSAIEYLKAHNIDSKVISRVLTGGQVRRDDNTALA